MATVGSVYVISCYLLRLFCAWEPLADKGEGANRGPGKVWMDKILLKL